MAIALFLSGYCVLYYPKIVDGWIMQADFALGVKILIVGIFCGSAVSIPALTDLAEIYENHSNPESNFIRHRKILSLLTGLITVLVFTSWTLMDFSTVFICSYAIASEIWIHIVTFRREQGKPGYLVLAVGGPLIAVTFLCLEFMGIWSKATTNIENHIENPLPTFIFNILIPLFIAFATEKKLNEPILTKIKDLQIFWVSILSKIISSALLLAFPFLGADVTRVNYATGVLFIQTIIAFILWFLGKYRLNSKVASK